MKIKSLLTMASPKVNYTVHKAILFAELILFAFFIAGGLTPTVTCAKNGEHSMLSRHFWQQGDERPAQAIDVRRWNVPNPEDFFKRLTQTLNDAYEMRAADYGLPAGEFVVLLEDTHAHIEWNPVGTRPNLKHYQPGIRFYHKGKPVAPGIPVS